MKRIGITLVATSLTFGLASAALAKDFSPVSKHAAHQGRTEVFQHRSVAAVRAPRISSSEQAWFDRASRTWDGGGR